MCKSTDIRCITSDIIFLVSICEGISMGGWRLEVGKMALYMSFPVAMFYIFNQPKYFEDWTVKMRRELYPPVDKMHGKV